MSYFYLKQFEKLFIFASDDYKSIGLHICKFSFSGYSIDLFSSFLSHLNELGINYIFVAPNIIQNLDITTRYYEVSSDSEVDF